MVFRIVKGMGGPAIPPETLWKGVFYLYQAAQYSVIALSFFLCHRVARRMGAREPWASILVAAMFLCNNPLLRLFRHQQVNLFLMAGCLICLLFRKQSALLAGFALSLAIHIKLYPALLLMPLLLFGHWGVIGWTMLGLVVFLGISLVSPGGQVAWGFFFAYLRNPLLGSALRDNSLHSLVLNVAKRFPTTLQGILPPYGPWVTHTAFFLSASLLVILTYRWWRWSRNADERTFLHIGVETLAAMLLVSPVAWEHYYVLAIPLAVSALSVIPPLSSPGRLLAIGAMFCVPTFDAFPLS